MKKELEYLLAVCLIISSMFQGNCQIDAYEYRIPIQQAEEGWNVVDLPLDIYGNVQTDLSDIRIYSKNSSDNNPVEQPYFIDIQSSKSEVSNIDFKLINTTRTGFRNSFTFEISNRVAVNNIHLDFSNPNFDWNIRVEGSMDQKAWSTIVSNQRIISLINQNTAFKYTDIHLPDSKFEFYRITFNSAKKPELKTAILLKETVSPSNYRSYPILQVKTEEDTSKKSTIISLDMGKKLPISHLKLMHSESNDFYRPIRIEGIVDSFKTEKGWNYRYKSLHNGIVNSFDENEFKFNTTLLQKLRITINNYDNQPLSVTDYKIKGPNYRLICRFEQENNLFLVYGNEKAERPVYDLTFFKNKIPDDINIVSLGPIEFFPKDGQTSDPLFKNKLWLWAILIIVILLLGMFTLKMLRDGG